MLESKGCRIRTGCEVHKVSTTDEGEYLKLFDETPFSSLLNEHVICTSLMTPIHMSNRITI